jgi:glycosyltransferase involved in cell wall biosynthesis
MRALVLTFHFPPSGGSGVQRVTKLARMLPALGVETTIVTVDAAAYEEHGAFGATDASLADEIPREVRVVRTPSGDRPRLRRFLRKTGLLDAAWRRDPTSWWERLAMWRGPCLAAASAEIRRSRPDVILASSPPFTTQLAAMELSNRGRIPWVMDLRDPWTGYFSKPWPSQAAKRWEEERESEAMHAAHAVVANTPGQRRELLERFPDVAPERIVAIPNGYDADDFRVAPAHRASDEVLVVHTGHVTCDPPGTSKPPPDGYAFDRSTHSLEWLFAAMAALRGRPGAPDVRARLVGKVDAAWVARAEALGLGGQVDFLGYLPHREATSHLLAADLLYLPTVGRRDGRPSANVPAKTYEYLGSGRPVAALADAGDVRDLMTGRARCTVLGARDAAGLADLIARITPGAAPHALPPDPPDAHPWRRDVQAKQMADVLKRVAASSSQRDE